MKPIIVALGFLAASAAVADDTLIFHDGFEVPPPPIAPIVTTDFIPPNIEAAANSQLAITLSNANVGVATLTADLVDTLPPGLLVSDISDATTSCLFGTVIGEVGAGVVSLSEGSQIPSQGNCTVSVSVTAAIVGTYTNTIAAGALQTDLGGNTADATTDLIVTEPAACNPAQLLEDPGFELTDTSAFPFVSPYWTGVDMVFLTPFCDEAHCGNDGNTALPHQGQFWVWMSRDHGGFAEMARISQDQVIPAGNSRFLNFWLRIGSVGSGTSYLDVTVDDAIVASIPEPPVAEASYSQRSIDISNFADGNLHTIELTYWDPAGSSVSGSYSIDDVTLDCLPAAIPTSLLTTHNR